MFISEKDKFIFVHVPKTGGTSMHIAFKDYYIVGDRTDPEPEEHHASLVKILNENMSIEGIEEYYTFGFVRNPWDRLVSGFHDFKQQRALLSGIEFKDFAINMAKGEGRYHELIRDVHFRPQYTFLDCAEKTIDFVGKFEDMINSFKYVMNELDLPPLTLYKHRSSSHPPYQHLYDDYTIAAVADLYKEDIKTFGYDYE